jgi:phage major head subunit gpT-like protein
MSPIVRGQMAFLLAPGLNLETYGKYRERPEQYRRYVTVKDSKKAYEESQAISGLGPLAKKGELETTILDEPFKLGGVRFIHETFALGFAVSKEMMDDDQYGAMRDLAGELGRSSRFTAELYGHDVFNNGFTTTKYVGRDGKALFATDHPLQGIGGTSANKPTVDVDLSEAALEAAIQSFEDQVEDRGRPIDLAPAILLISPLNEMLARRLLQSAGMPGGNLNDINPLQGRLNIVVSHYIVDKDAWFVLAPPGDVSIKMYWREMPDTKTWDDDDADAVFHKIRQRHSVGFDDWRGTYASSGA